MASVAVNPADLPIWQSGYLREVWMGLQGVIFRGPRQDHGDH